MGDQERKTKEARIARLKDRLDQVGRGQGSVAHSELVAIIKGLLDLLADEL